MIFLAVGLPAEFLTILFLAIEPSLVNVIGTVLSFNVPTHNCHESITTQEDFFIDNIGFLDEGFNMNKMIDTAF
jgi:hypothetical protein